MRLQEFKLDGTLISQQTLMATVERFNNKLGKLNQPLKTMRIHKFMHKFYQVPIPHAVLAMDCLVISVSIPLQVIEKQWVLYDVKNLGVAVNTLREDMEDTHPLQKGIINQESLLR